MRRDRFLCAVALLVVAACSRGSSAPEPHPAPAAPAPAPVRSTAPASQPPATATAIAIDRFDCLKVEDADPDGGVPAATPGIAAWNGGGPSGATWNATELRCSVAVRSSCTSGTADVQLRVGKALVAHRTVPLVAGHAEPAFVVAPAGWRKNLDDGKAAPVRTAVFRATALLTCKTPVEVAPGLGPRREFAADRAFVAGFADGE